MEYDWDKTNLSKYGVPFEEAKTVFDDTLYVDFYDPDHSIGEHRFILLGNSAQGRLLVVSYIELNNGIRLISAREATLSERKAYEQVSESLFSRKDFPGHPSPKIRKNHATVILLRKPAPSRRSSAW